MGTQVFRSNVDCINYRIDILLDMIGDITMHSILFLFSKYCRTGSHDRHQITQEGNQQRKGYCLGAAMVFVEWNISTWSSAFCVVKGLVPGNAMQVNLYVFHLSGEHNPSKLLITGVHLLYCSSSVRQTWRSQVRHGTGIIWTQPGPLSLSAKAVASRIF